MSIKDDQANLLVNKGLQVALEGVENAQSELERKNGLKDLELFLGFDEKEAFSQLSYKEQESVINGYIEKSRSGDFLGSAEELMQGLHYKPPAATPATPTPTFSAPAPGGMGGGGRVVRFQRPPTQQTTDNDATKTPPSDDE